MMILFNDFLHNKSDFGFDRWAINIVSIRNTRPQESVYKSLLVVVVVVVPESDTKLKLPRPSVSGIATCNFLLRLVLQLKM